MNKILLGLIIGICIGFVFGVGLAFLFVYFWCQNKHTQLKSRSQKVVKSGTAPVLAKGVDSSTSLSGSNVDLESTRSSEWSNMPLWLDGLRRKDVGSACGIPKYSYKYVLFFLFFCMNAPYLTFFVYKHVSVRLHTCICFLLFLFMKCVYWGWGILQSFLHLQIMHDSSTLLEK